MLVFSLPSLQSRPVVRVVPVGAAMSHGNQVAQEPVAGQVSYFLQRAWFLEEVGCAWDNPKFGVRFHLPHRGSVQVYHRGIIPPNDQKGGSRHLFEHRSGQVGTSSPGHDRPDQTRPFRRCD